MSARIFDRVRALLRNGNGADDTDGDEPRGRLFECEDCETIFISEKRRSCPECGRDLESIPTGKDLGLG